MSAGSELAGFHILGGAPRGARDFVLAAIIEGDGEIEPVIGGGARFGPIDDFENVSLKTFTLADHPHPHAFARQPVEIARDIEAQEIEERVHLFYRTAPVLGREAEHREVAHAEFAGGLHRAPQRLHALGVPERARAARADAPSGRCRP